MIPANISSGCRLSFSASVTATHLPFGGIILVNGVTLQTIEFSEQEAELVNYLLDTGFPPPEAGDAVRGYTARLIDEGWLSVDAASKTEV